MLDQGAASTTMMLVDDDDRLRSVLRAVLADSGVEIVAELDEGRDAVQICRDLAPDVVVLDMKLPDRPGLAVADAIRRFRPDQPIVLFSALIDPKTERVATAHGLVHLEKCDGVEALEDAMRRAIDRRAARQFTSA